MRAATDRLEFAPPPQPGLLRAMVLAVIAHLLLMLALTWGIRWNRDIENLSAEAELWSPTVQQAAPRAVEAPPPPPAPPVVKEPPVVAPPPPGPSEAEIAVEREKKRLAEEKRREDELERQRKLAEQKKLEEQKKQEQAKKAAEDRKRQEELAKAKARQQEEAKRLEDLRKKNIERALAQAGTGSPSATGTAPRSTGPSDSYAGRIRARVRPNIVFTDDVAGNPLAEVEVRLAPDGTITSKRIVKSSGVKTWDDAVLRALDKTEILPRDIDGRVHTPLTIEFRPKS